MEKFIEKLNLIIRENDVLRLRPIKSWDDLGMRDPHHCKDYQYYIKFCNDGSILIVDTYWTSHEWMDLNYFIETFKVGKLTKLEVWFNWDEVITKVNPKEYDKKDLIFYSTQHGYYNQMYLIKKGTEKLSTEVYNDRIYRADFHETIESMEMLVRRISNLEFLTLNRKHSESDKDIHYLDDLITIRKSIEQELEKIKPLCEKYPIF